MSEKERTASAVPAPLRGEYDRSWQAYFSLGLYYFVTEPLACLSVTRGYVSRLLFYVLLPFAIIMAILAWQLFRKCSLREALEVSAQPILTVLFLAYVYVTKVIFDAWPCYDFGAEGRYLIADVNMECGTPEHGLAVALAVASLSVYSVGLMALYGVLLCCARKAIKSRKVTPLSMALNFIHKDYAVHYCFWELMEMFRKLMLVGVFQLILPGSVMQIIIAFFFSFMYLVIQLQAAPFRWVQDNYVALVASMLICTQLFCCIVTKIENLVLLPSVVAIFSDSLVETYSIPENGLATLLLGSVVGALIFATCIAGTQSLGERARLREENIAAKSRRLHDVDTDEPIEAPEIPHDKYHLFLSHVWKTGQDQTRIIKQRLDELVPGFKVFLDIDNLEEGRGMEDVDKSYNVLIFFSSGYLLSVNCVREMLRAMHKKTPIITVFETNLKHGGVDTLDINRDIETCVSKLEKWGLAQELRNWGQPIPTASEIHDALMGNQPIEWERISVFQDITFRLIVERCIPKTTKEEASLRVLPASVRSKVGGFGTKFGRSKDGSNHGAKRLTVAVRRRLGSVTGSVYSKPGVRQRLDKQMKDNKRAACKVFYGRHNLGAYDFLLNELLPTCPSLEMTCDPFELAECCAMFVYLDARTWTSGPRSRKFALEVESAIDADVHLLLGHEMPGLNQESRFPAPFETFFVCEGGTTPKQLLEAGIYNEIAQTLKGGPFRQASIDLVLKAVETAAKRAANDASASALREKQTAERSARTRFEPSFAAGFEPSFSVRLRKMVGMGSGSGPGTSIDEGSSSSFPRRLPNKKPASLRQSKHAFADEDSEDASTWPDRTKSSGALSSLSARASALVRTNSALLRTKNREAMRDAVRAKRALKPQSGLVGVVSDEQIDIEVVEVESADTREAMGDAVRGKRALKPRSGLVGIVNPLEESRNTSLKSSGSARSRPPPAGLPPQQLTSAGIGSSFAADTLIDEPHLDARCESIKFAMAGSRLSLRVAEPPVPPATTGTRVLIRRNDPNSYDGRAARVFIRARRVHESTEEPPRRAGEIGTVTAVEAWK